MKRSRPARKSAPAKVPDFVLCAERALCRAAKNVQAEHRAANLPLMVWQDGKVVKISA